MNSPYGPSGDIDTYLARAELLVELDRYDEARDEIGGALSIDPAHVPSLTLLAVLELQVNHPDDALTAASAALAAEPTHDPAVLARGHALALLHRTNEAVETAEDFQERNPDSWWHHVHYALVIHETRNSQDALDAAWVAVHLAPEEARAHLTLAAVAARLGLEDLAERALAAAARFDPESLGYLESEHLGARLLRGRPHSVAETAKPSAPRTRLGDAARRVFRFAGGFGIGIPVLTALISGGNLTVGRAIAGIGTVIGIVTLVVVMRKLPADDSERLRVGIDSDKTLGLCVIAAALGPVLPAVFALTGFVYALAGAMVAGLATMALVGLRYRD